MRAVVAECDVLLTQLEIPVPTATAAARQARTGGATVMVNASPAGENSRRWPGWRPTPTWSSSMRPRRANGVAANHMVVTRGAPGVPYAGDTENFGLPAPAVEAVDTTGAGDVFAGVLAANWPRPVAIRCER